MRSFADKVRELVAEKRSVLCVSIDPALPNRRDRFTIPPRYIERTRAPDEAILSFCLDLVDQLHDLVVAFKFNLWYMLELSSKKDLAYLAVYAKRRGALTILDCKVNDIEDTLEVGLQIIAELGFDCLTANPLPGNLSSVVNILTSISQKFGRDFRIGVLVLTTMSNKGSTRYFLECESGSKKLYKIIAEDVANSGADGCVVGATYTPPEVVQDIRVTIGRDRVMFFTGIGVQGGGIDIVKYALPGLVLINVGRSVIYAENPREAAMRIHQLTRSIAEQVRALS